MGKGQATVFALAGMLLLFGAVLLLIPRQPPAENSAELSFQQSAVKQAVNICLARLTDEGLRLYGNDEAKVAGHIRSSIAACSQAPGTGQAAAANPVPACTCGRYHGWDYALRCYNGCACDNKYVELVKNAELQGIG